MSGLDPIPEENGAWEYYYKIYYDDDDDFSPPENQNYKYTTPMAEGGYDPMDPTTEETPLIPDTGMTMTTLTHGITPTNGKSQNGAKSKGSQPLVKPTARNPLNQVPLPPQRANKCLCPQEQGFPKSNKGLAQQKPLSLQGIPRASVCEPCRKKWHGVRLAGSFRWPTQANLICGTRWHLGQAGAVAAL